MLSDMALSSFSLFELLIVEDSILLVIYKQKFGKKRKAFSNVLRSSFFLFAIKDDFAVNFYRFT